jgi:hypothetical protein
MYMLMNYGTSWEVILCIEIEILTTLSLIKTISHISHVTTTNNDNNNRANYLPEYSSLVLIVKQVSFV